ncbi:hypothetical protein D1007_35631 [Hordeum vulgare]|nr:hypothetical protein D1007_35631 [Hordeum vulgare]
MTRAECFLERVEVALHMLSFGPSMVSTTLMSCPTGVAGVASTEELSQELYRSFSARVRDIASSLSTLSLVVPTTEVKPNAVLEAPTVHAQPTGVMSELCFPFVCQAFGGGLISDLVRGACFASVT